MNLTITIILLVVIVAIVSFYCFVEYKQSKNKNHVLDLILNKYNVKLAKVSEQFKDKVNLTKKRIIFNQREDFCEEEIFNNIKILSKISKNYEIISHVSSEKENPDAIKELELLEDLNVVSDLRYCNFSPNNIQANILNIFKNNLRFNKIHTAFAPFFSSSTAYSIDRKYLFMPLSNGVLIIDIENLFSTSFVEWKDVKFKLELVEEHYVPYDYSVVLEDTTHKQELNEKGIKYDLMLEKNYVLKVETYKTNLSVFQSEVLTERNETMTNVIEVVNNFDKYKDYSLADALIDVEANKSKPKKSTKKATSKKKK